MQGFKKENIRVYGITPFAVRVRSIIEEYPYWWTVENDGFTELHTVSDNGKHHWTYYLIEAKNGEFFGPDECKLYIGYPSIYSRYCLILNDYIYQDGDIIKRLSIL